MTINSNIRHQKFDVVGIGNAIVDILIQTEDSFLEKHSLKKGSMALLNDDDAEKLYSSIGAGLESSGGSAANTLAGLAQLGSKAGFIGRVRNDQLGEIFTHDIRSAGARFDTTPKTSGPPTARCLIFVTPDAQRTMCTYLGASVFLDPEDLDLSMVKQTKVLYLEGFLWDHPAAKRAFIAAAKACKDSGGKVALSLSDSFCVERHRKSFLALVEEHIDILFANEAEITSLYEVKEFQEAISKVRNRCEIAALTRGEKGSVILSEKEHIEIHSYKFGQLIDTTGAGDLYAGGFLNGYTTGQSLLKCGQIASICAGQIVTQLGPRSRVSLKNLLSKNLP